MCMGGGNGAAAAQQQASNTATLVNNNVDKINASFANRAPQYAQFLKGTQGQYQQQLAAQNAIATRNLKFALARGGQTGGSLATDQGAELGREQAAGALSGQQKAEGALSGLETQDQSQRLQMISQAQAGGDIGNGAQQTANALQANLGAANTAAAVNSLGDVFGGISDTVNKINNQQALIKGVNASQKYANPFGANA